MRRDGKFVDVPWSEVVIGDVVMVEEGDMFPADLILLASSIQGGNAYIETASLDGIMLQLLRGKELEAKGSNQIDVQLSR